MTESQPEPVKHGAPGRRPMEDSFGWLLGAILASMFLLGAVAETRLGRALGIVVVGAIFFFTLWISATSIRRMLISTVVVPFVLVLAGLAGASEAKPAATLATVATALIVLGSVSVIIRRITKHDRVSVQTVLGALCIYLLVAIFFSLVYRAIALTTGLPFFVQTEDPASIDYIYYSFVCITTLGFGDLSPASDTAKMASIIEAVIGQLYLVTVVALFVGNLGRQRHQSGG